MADTTSMISPGIYTNIISLDSYLTSTSGTIGFVPIITEKGEDNVLKRITSYQEYIENFGEPDIRTFGKYYGCGPYIATQHLSVSSDLYVLRALPDDATYAHTFIYYSNVPDFPIDYKFARTYKDVILDAATKEVDLYTVKAYTTAELREFYYKSAIEDGVAYDEDGALITVGSNWRLVKYTTSTKYADYTCSTETYYSFLASASKMEAVKSGKGYDDNLNKVVFTATEETAEDTDSDKIAKANTAVWTKDDPYKDVAGSTKVKEFNIVYTKVEGKKATVAWESTSSLQDGNVGYTKITTSAWYDSTHTSLSAFSIVPGTIYGVQSDVVCKRPVTSTADVYVVDPTKIQDAFNHKALYSKIGDDVSKVYVVLDPADLTATGTTFYTTKVQYTATPGSTGTAVESINDYSDAIVAEDDVVAVAFNYTQDTQPWYVIDDSKKDDAIANYAAFDKYGFLTQDKIDAKYTSDTTWAKKDADTQSLVTETDVPLLVPVTQKVVVNSANMLYTFDRKGAFEASALEDMRKGMAFDQNGRPARSASSVYVTMNLDHAVKAKAPKMNNTQMLDAMFNGNDALILAAISGLGELQPAIYSKNNRLAHKSLLGYVRAIGRGSYYNDYSIKIVSDANPSSFGTYKFQVFKLSDGAEVLCESYNVSFDPTALDADGETMYWVDVINKYSDMIRVDANDSAVDLFTSEMAEFYHNDPTIADVAGDQVFTNNKIIDGKLTTLEFPLVGGFPTVIPQFDSDENSETYGQVINADMNDFTDTTYNGDTPFFGYKSKIVWEAYYAKAWAEKHTFDAAAQYNAALELADDDSTKTFQIETAIDEMNIAQDMTTVASDMLTWATSRNLMNMNDSDSITAGEQTYYLENGSLGSLIDSKKGTVVPQVGNQILAQAYTGLLKNPVVVKNVDESTGTIKYKQQYTDNVYDTDWIYFTIVYDPGYKPDVKQAALELVDTYRRDCVLISDCGDNAGYDDCLKYVGYVKGGADARIWNTYLAARYEPYSRVYDKFTAKDIWVSPVYHMAKLLPQTDALYALWYAAAGFTRGVCSDIKELRYSPNKAQRDLLYQAQVNPIVYFPEGMTVWGQLTTQKANDTLSDLNAVRCVLYIKRAIEQYCRNYVFEMNNQTTWDAIKSGITPMLDTIVAHNGLRSYQVEVAATDYELKTKTCHVNVTLEPMKVLEKIQLNMYIK